MQLSDSILDHLDALFNEVVRAVTTGDPDEWGELGHNPKGDQVKWFDLAADRAVSTYLQERFPYSVRLWSEEGEARSFGSAEPEFVIVLDPVDGSNNFARGIAPAGMAVALLPANRPITVENVQYALVGDIFSGITWTAARGKGAHSSNQPLSTSEVTRLEEAILSCDEDRFVMQAPLTDLLSRARGARAFGCASRSLVMVATGSIDAHLDVRNLLTPENFLAPALIITEAGGLVTDPAGKPLPVIRAITDSFSIVATATPELHQTLLHRLAE